MDIIVIGAGLIGMATAWRLAAEGHRVTVVDREDGTAHGTSHANGGQLSYSYVAPMADGSIWRQLPKLLFSPGSPVRVRAGIDLHQYRWLWRFLASANDERALRTIAELGALARHSRAVLHGVEGLAPETFHWTRTGKLVVYGTPESLAAADAQARLQGQWGTRRDRMTRDGCLDIEPALAPIAGRIVGGLFSPDDETADPFLLCRALEDRLRQRDDPVDFRYRLTVRKLVRQNGRIVGIETDEGRRTADLVVLAAGLHSRALGRTVGLDLPLYPIKGYSLSAPIRPDDVAPHVSVTDAARRVVLARLGPTLRVAGVADLVGDNVRIDPRRIARLQRDIRADFPDAADWDGARLWAGLRPATPTGMPIIGESGIDGLLLNLGHGALGLTLAFGSADMLAAHIAGRTAPVPLAPFALGSH